MKKLIFLAILITSCGSVEKKKEVVNSRITLVEQKYIGVGTLYYIIEVDGKEYLGGSEGGIILLSK